MRSKEGDDASDARVYVLDSQHLTNKLPGIDIPKMKSADENPSDEWPTLDESSLYLPYGDATRTFLYPLPPSPMVLTFPHITRRVAAQRSQFILFGSDPSWLSKEIRSLRSTIDVLRIDGKSAGVIRKQLREAGVTESVIFPDLDGLGREFHQLWRDRGGKTQAQRKRRKLRKNRIA